jgi:hypothetical protein
MLWVYSKGTLNMSFKIHFRKLTQLISWIQYYLAGNFNSKSHTFVWDLNKYFFFKFVLWQLLHQSMTFVNQCTCTGSPCCTLLEQLLSLFLLKLTIYRNKENSETNSELCECETWPNINLTTSLTKVAPHLTIISETERWRIKSH